MPDNTGRSRRGVLQLSSGLLGAGLLDAAGATTKTGAVDGAEIGSEHLPAVTDVTFYDVATTGLELGDVSVPGGETIRPVASIGNGLFAASGGENPEFYAVSDSGPDFDCEEAREVAGRDSNHFCGEASGAVRPVPDYSPTIYRMQLGDDQRVTRSETTALTDSAGNEITSLTNPLSNGTETMFSVEGETISHDPNGLDIEGIARTADETFWVGEEYAPGLCKLSADGEVLTRYVPETLESDVSEATYPVRGTLPEIFKRRDRGIESIGLSPDDSTVYFAHQSPLANPDEATGEGSRNVRLGTFDPETERVSSQYLYRLDEPETFEKDAAAGEVVQSDVKVSELSVLESDRLLVLERISQTTKFYVVDLTAVDPIPDSYDELSTRPTLAAVDPETDARLEPLPKRLLFTTDDYDGFQTKLEGIARPNPDELLIVNDNDYTLFGSQTRVARVRLDGALGVDRTDESGPSDQQTDGILSHLGRYSTGVYDDGAAEIPAYHPDSQRLFVVNGSATGIDVLDVSDPTTPTKETTIDVGMGGPNNVSVSDGIVAAAVEAENTQESGVVAFYDAAELTQLTSVDVGPLPDAVTFTDDGNYVLAANEGEPNDDYSVDPAGSVSIIDISEGVGNASVDTASFTRFDGQEASLRDRGIRIFGPGSNASQDLEPEYIATAGTTAYVTLQENNALAIVDIESAEVTALKALGSKDHSLPGNALDAVEDEEIDITTQPVYGMYQQDTIETYDVDGETYLIATNEGDAREYDALFETGVLKQVDGQWGLDATEDDGDDIDVAVDASGFDDGVLDSLAGLEVTTEYGDTDDDGDIEELHLFGARSISIHDADGTRVYESGDTIEQLVAGEQPAEFNSDDDENGMDAESVASGPEPEGLAVGTVGDTTYAFVGLEEVSAVMTLDVTTPESPTVVDYTNTRNFDVGPEDEIEEGSRPADAAGDLSPEGVILVSASDSPIDEAMLAVSYEVSGTTSLYRVGGAGETNGESPEDPTNTGSSETEQPTATEEQATQRTGSPTTTSTGASGPGFGVIGALGGLGLGTWRLLRADDDG